MRVSQQIGWSQESKLIYELIKQTEELNKFLPGNLTNGHVNISRQIGWSNESNLYYEWLKSLAKLQREGTITTTTSTTTTLPPIPSLRINPPSTNTFDIPEYPSPVEGESSDFTIEWLQYMHTDTSFPRIYSIGQYPAQNAVSIEGDTLYLWLNGSIFGSAYLPDYIDPYLDTWIHIVITRKTTDLGVWANGIKIIEFSTYTSAIPTNGLDFYIGSENAENTYYNGLISNFRWSQGAVYGTDPPPPYPTNPLTVLDSTILLIGTGTDLTSQLTDQTGVNTITASGCVYNTNSGISGYDGSLQFGTI